MCNTKKVFAVLFAVMAAMLMQTAVFASSITELGLEKDGDGYYLVNTYAELKDALAADEYGKKIRLNADITETENVSYKYLLPKESPTLDLNGHILQRTGKFTDYALFLVKKTEFIIEDSSGDNSGTCIFANPYGDFPSVIRVTENGVLTVNGGSFYYTEGYCQTNASAVMVEKNGVAYLNDGVFETTCKTSTAVFLFSSNLSYGIPSAFISGGKYKGLNDALEIDQFGDYKIYPYISVRGGEFYSVNDSFAYCSGGWGYVPVFGGRVGAKCMREADQFFADGIRKKSVDIDGISYYDVTQPAYIVSSDMTAGERIDFETEKIMFDKCKTYVQNHTTADLFNETQALYSSPCPVNVNRDTKFGINVSDSNYTVKWFTADTYDGDDTLWTAAGTDKTYDFTCGASGTTVYLKAVVNVPADNYTFTDVVALKCDPSPVITHQPLSGVTVFWISAENAESYEWCIKDENGTDCTWAQAEANGWGYPRAGSEKTPVLSLFSMGHNLEGKQVYCKVTGNGKTVCSDIVKIGKFIELGTHLNIYDLQIPFPGVEFGTDTAYTDSNGYTLENLELVYGKDYTEVNDKYIDFDGGNSYAYYAEFIPKPGYCFTEDSIASKYNINGFCKDVEHTYKYTGTIDRQLKDGKATALLVPTFTADKLYPNTKPVYAYATKTGITVRNFYDKNYKAALSNLGAPNYKYSLDNENWYDFGQINGGAGPFGGLIPNTEYTVYFKNANTDYVFKTMQVKTFPVKGDVDENNKVEKADAKLLLTHIAKDTLDELTNGQKAAADVCTDDNIDILDVAEILNMLK